MKLKQVNKNPKSLNKENLSKQVLKGVGKKKSQVLNHPEPLP